MAVLAKDMSGHVESNNVGYDGTHGYYGYNMEIGMQTTPGFWSLQTG